MKRPTCVFLQSFIDLAGNRIMRTGRSCQTSVVIGHDVGSEAGQKHALLENRWPVVIHDSS